VEGMKGIWIALCRCNFGVEGKRSMLMELIGSRRGISRLNLVLRGLHTINREGDCLGRDRKEETEERQLKSFKVEWRFRYFQCRQCFVFMLGNWLCVIRGCHVGTLTGNYTASHFPGFTELEISLSADICWSRLEFADVNKSTLHSNTHH
jgi:hypothetical protein